MAAKKPSKPVDVAALHLDHPRVSAQDWRSPLVRRLTGKTKYADGEATLWDSFRGQDLKAVDAKFNLRWAGLKDDFNRRMNTYQEPVITEHATLGLACILLTRHTKLQISEVCRRGEAVDYWLGDGMRRKRFVLEVGGQQGGSLEALSTQKTKQLFANPWGKPGFICVAVYDGAAARLWFCTHGSTV